MAHLTHLTNYFKETSRVPRTHGTREKVDNKCVNFVKSVNLATVLGRFLSDILLDLLDDEFADFMFFHT